MNLTNDQKIAALNLLQWVDSNSTSLTQALLMAAEHNERDAALCEASDQQAVGQVLRESGAGWRRHSDRLENLMNALEDVDFQEVNEL